MTAFVTGVAQRRFRVLLQLAQDERGDLRRRESLLAQHHADDRLAAFRDTEREELQFLLHVGDAAAHQALHRIDGAVGMIDQFAAGRVADDDVAVGQRARQRSGPACRRLRLR